MVIMSVSVTTTTTTSSVSGVSLDKPVVPIVLRITDADGSQLYPAIGVRSLFALCAIAIGETIKARKSRLEDDCFFALVGKKSFIPPDSIWTWEERENRRLPFLKRLYQVTIGQAIQTRNNEYHLRPNGQTYLEYIKGVNAANQVRLANEKIPYIELFDAVKNSMKQRLPDVLHGAVDVRTIKVTDIRGRIFNITMSGGVPGTNFQDLAVEVNRLLSQQIFDTTFFSWKVSFAAIDEYEGGKEMLVCNSNEQLSILNAYQFYVHKLLVSSSVYEQGILAADWDLKVVPINYIPQPPS